MRLLRSNCLWAHTHGSISTEELCEECQIVAYAVRMEGIRFEFERLKVQMAEISAAVRTINEGRALAISKK